MQKWTLNIIIKLLVTNNSPNPFYVFVFFSTGCIYFRSKLSPWFTRVQVFQGDEVERIFICFYAPRTKSSMDVNGLFTKYLRLSSQNDFQCWSLLFHTVRCFSSDFGVWPFGSDTFSGVGKMLISEEKHRNFLLRS